MGGSIPKWESLLKDSFADYFHATSLKSRGVQLETFAHLLAAEYGGHAIFTALDAKFFRGLPEQFKNRVGNNPHHMLFRMAVNLLLDAADEEEKACGNRGLVVSLICDQDEETSTMCLKWINKLKKSDPRARRRIASICFADSRKNIALQAADLLAYAVRERIQTLGGQNFSNTGDMFSTLAYRQNALGQSMAKGEGIILDANVLKELSAGKHPDIMRALSWKDEGETKGRQRR